MTRLKISIVLFLASFYSCHSPDNLARHYSEGMFDSALRLANSGSLKEATHLANESYAKFPFVSVADKYRYNSFMYDVFHSFYSPVKNDDSALAWAGRNLQLLEQNELTNKMAQEYAVTFSLEGEIYIEQKNYDAAFYCFSRSMLIAQNIHDSCLQAEYNSTLGLVLYRQSRLPQAIMHYKEAFLQVRNCPDNAKKYHQVQGWLDNLGIFYIQSGMADSALFFLQEAESYIETKKALYSHEPSFPAIAVGVVYGNQARAFQLKQAYDKAEVLFKKAIAINSQKGYDNNSALLNRLRLCDLYILQKRRVDALAVLNDTEKLLPQNNDDTRLFWAKTASQYYTAYGNKRQANASLIAYLRHKDTADTESEKLRNINVDNAFLRMESNYKISLLEKENQATTGYLVFAILAGCMTVIIAGFIWRSWSKSKKHNEELSMLHDQVMSKNAQMEQALTALEKSHEEHARIMKIVAHDLRGPVSAISNFVDLMLDGGLDQESLQQALLLMQQTNKNTLSLVGELLEFDTSTNTIVREPINLPALLQGCVLMLNHKAVEKQQQIEFLPVEAHTQGDPEKLWRVFGNLITNAIKFSAPHTTITVRLQKVGKTALVTVQDQGIGIPDNLKDKLFTLSSQVKRKGTAGEVSFGLGLSIAKQIVEAHEGRIWFETMQQAGTWFYVELPLEKG